MKLDPVLRELASACGIALAYHDTLGELHEVTAQTARALLDAMGVHDRVPEPPAMNPMTVVRSDDKPWRVRVRGALSQPLVWRLRGEDGIERQVAIDADHVALVEPEVADLALDADLEVGYYELSLLAAGHATIGTTLAVAPPACYRPPVLHGGKAWGFAVQLYSVRSARNWGIGDLTDLSRLIDIAQAAGADVVGVNPLHALHLHDPTQASPYSPSSRQFLNPLYLDVEAIAGFAPDDALPAKLETLRASPLVDYADVARTKLDVLRKLHAQSAASPQFAEFKARGGESLRRHALFEALQANFFARDRTIWGCPAWPDAYRRPELPAVEAFGQEHAVDVDFYAWLQWQAGMQRDQVGEHARRAKLAVGLYADMAVSVAPGGAAVWANQSLYAKGVSIGAPPDAFSRNGQDWGLPPPIPFRMRDEGYASFLATLRANMRGVGALRLDHVMGLMRLFWVPHGATPGQGAYVHYPFEDLLGLLALESHRYRCVVIGEDLGTVPDEVRTALARNDILSYRVLWFERDANGGFKAPADYPEPALAVASTHDLPTIAGWWEGDDIRLRQQRGLLGPDADVAGLLAERARDCERLLAALADTGVTARAPNLAEAIHSYLARTPCVLMVAQAEDAFAVREQANLPGTVDQYPNWRRKLPVAIEHWSENVRWLALRDAIAASRPVR